MHSPNYFLGIVKVLEKPKPILQNNRIFGIKYRVLFPQIRKNRKSKVISVIFYQLIQQKSNNYYDVNDYILIEGYSSVNIDSNSSKIRKLNIIALKSSVLSKSIQ